MWNAEGIRRRIDELAAEDPDLRRFGAHRHRYRLGAPLSEDAIEQYEARHGFTFPASYRAFLLEVGDGGAGPHYGLFRHDGSEAGWRARTDPAEFEPGSLGRPFPHTGGFGIPDPIPPCSLHPKAVTDEDDPCWYDGSVWISELGCGAFDRLILTGPAAGQVWGEDYGSDQILSPGRDFHDWYTAWLACPLPVPKPLPVRGRTGADD